MLRPTKHSHPDRTVVNVALLLLKHLRKRRLDRYGELRHKLLATMPSGDRMCLEYIEAMQAALVSR